MDYNKLYELIPKEPRRWNPDDVDKWLDHIGMQVFITPFRENSIDGSCLEVLTEQDLTELGVESNLKRKKMMQWIQVGLVEFKAFVQKRNGTNDWSIASHSEQQQQTNIPCTLHEQYQPIKMPSTPHSPSHHIKQYANEHPKQYESEGFGFNEELIESQKVIEPPVLNQDIARQMAVTVFSQPYSNSVQQQPTMVIQDETGKQVLVTTKPVRFGRSPENEVVLTEEYVSRFHCHVILKNDKFFLQDLGSTSGTFVSLTHPALLRQGLILHMGSQQIQLTQLVYVGDNCDVTAVFLDGKDMGKEFKFGVIKNKTEQVFGRVLDNFNDDIHLSGQHAKFTYTDDGFIVQDLGSRNGTWLRLSESQKQSDPVRLFEGRQFRLGFEKFFTCMT